MEQKIKNKKGDLKMTNFTDLTVGELLEECSLRGIAGMEGLSSYTLIDILRNDEARKVSVPTEETLMAKSITELQVMCEEAGINGLGNQPKNVLVMILLNSYNKRGDLDGVKASLIVEKNEDGDTKVLITVSCGGNDDDFDVSGRKVSEIAVLLCSVLNIPDDAYATVNGEEVNGDYVIREGDALDFVQDVDDKGGNN